MTRQPKVGFKGLGYFTNHYKKFMFQKSTMKMFTALSELDNGLRFSLRDSQVIKTQFTQPHNYSILQFLKSQNFITEEYLERKFFKYHPTVEWRTLCHTVRMTDFMQRGSTAALGVDMLFYLQDHPLGAMSATIISDLGYIDGGMMCIAKNNLLFEKLVKKYKLRFSAKDTYFKLTKEGQKLVKDIEHVQTLIKPFLEL